MARIHHHSFDNSLAADAASPCRLWILRSLVLLGAHRVFVRNEGFDNDALAEALGLVQWINPPDDSFDPSAARAELRRLHVRAEKQTSGLQYPAILTRNLDRLARLVDLSDVDRQILGFAAHLKTEVLLDAASDWLGSVSSAKTNQVLATLLDLPEDAVRAALSPNGMLARTGLVSVDRRDKYTLSGKLEFINRSLPDLLLTCDDDDLATLFKDVVKKAPPPTLKTADFGHLQRTLEVLQPYLGHALGSQRRGVNVFLYGIPGTGKSELARVLAEELGCELLEISGEDDEGDAVNGEQRLRAYRAAQSFFTRRRALLVFDEAEDIFNDGNNFFGRKSTAQTRKAWINRALEDNPVPTLWLSNSVSGLDPAFVRRFDMVVEVTVPPKPHRQRILAEACGDILPPESLARIAECEAVAPALITRAASVVEAVAGDLPAGRAAQAVEYLISNTLRAQGHPPVVKVASLPETYDPGLVHADADLARIADGIANSRSARLCLYGPPGTGKSAYGRWLAERLGLALHQRRASDLVSKWVGETERNIARAFREAEESGALLLLDEVDSFLQERSGAQRSWEITEVNEMLTQMEAYDGVLIATTNLVDGLDRAALRRFDLKVKFDYLRPEQAWSLLGRHCALRDLVAPDDRLRPRLARLDRVTPGDFAAVARQQRFRPLASAVQFVEALEAECAIREGMRSHAIGFL